MSAEIQLHIAGMVYNQSLGGTYSLVLAEDGGLKRRFSVLIGEAEAQSIAMKLNNTKSSRPLSHDLMNSIIKELTAKLIKVVIYEMINDVFYSKIYLKRGDEMIIIDSRTSDAVALAVRCDAPIYILSHILDIVGTVVNFDGTEKQPADSDAVNLYELTPALLTRVSNEQLQRLLEQSINDEHYEAAAMIRDEMEKRK